MKSSTAANKQESERCISSSYDSVPKLHPGKLTARAKNSELFHVLTEGF